MVFIKWHGHACFEVKIDEKTLAFDPHDGVSLGIPTPSFKADIILVSHDHFDHNAVNVVKKPDSIVIKANYVVKIQFIKLQLKDLH